MNEKRKYIKSGKNGSTLRKKSKCSKNDFIQRGRQMEQMQRTESGFLNKIEKDISETTANLVPILSDQTEFYEQLLTEYNSFNTVSILQGSNNSILEEREMDHSGEQTDSADYKQNNTFMNRFDFDLSSDDINSVISKQTQALKGNWSAIGHYKIDIPILKSFKMPDVKYYQPHKVLKQADLQILNVKLPLTINVSYPLTPLQTEIFNIANNYLDLYYPQRSHNNAEEIRFAYCVHTINHILQSRALILRNNEKVLGLVKHPKALHNEVPIPDSLRDQGLFRMKALIILPFRESALKTVKIIAKLLFENRMDHNANPPITKFARFLEEFSGNNIHFPKTNPKPFDYEKTFNGNTDDNFKIGIRLTKKSMSLYSDLSVSDILIASPLALRMIINDKDQNFDFMNSIEVLIIDQADLFLAQNWENLLYVLDHLHLQPQHLPNTNCQRVRKYCLNGTSRFYRQTLFFSSHELPEFRAVINNKCHNFQGKLRTINKVKNGDICNVITPVQQVFQRIDCSSVELALEDRFQYFVQNVLPQFIKVGCSHCLLYVPSYFDYVRFRNYFKKEMINFVQISEYTKKEKISRARDIFFHSGAPILLYSERAHFFRRTRIKGVRHLIFYQPPNFPNFYSELINLMLELNQNPRDGLQNTMSVKTMYTKFDLLSLSNLIGNENAIRLTSGESSSYLFSNKD